MKEVEFGADAKGSRTSRSWGETVPMLVELDEDMLLDASYNVGTAGEEKAEELLLWLYAADEAPPSKAVNSSKRSMSIAGESLSFGLAELRRVNVP